jgi:NOL1/NOP2/sun family putative RNA methylase
VKEKLPQEFIEEIDRLLEDQAQDFWTVIVNDPSNSGLRVNSNKVNPGILAGYFPGSFESLPWSRVGFQIQKDVKFGIHPFHSAGLYYLQEPSAMAPVSVLDPQPGEWILDLCAAPGGKTTQILSAMKDQGLLVANDPNPKRAQALARNIDRWGARNTILTLENPKKLADHFGPVFDRVLVDAPCSGEGTFRSSPGEIKKWSSSFSERCATLQDDILWNAGRLVRPGGILVYSTCTFNQLENEGSVSRFLKANPEFIIDPILPCPGFSRGITSGKLDPYNLKSTVRIWPHLAPGEGHFIARMKKKEGPYEEKRIHPDPEVNLDSYRKDIYGDFFKRTIKQTPSTSPIMPGNKALACHGYQLFRIPENAPSPSGLKVLRWGWLLGSFKSNRFIPSHALAAGLEGTDTQIVLEFSLGDPDLHSYLRGSPIKNIDQRTDRTWLHVLVEGFPLGWGKDSQGRIKSYIPGWLRRN